MKIRHKQSGVVLEGHYTTCTDALNMRRPRSYFMSTDYSRYSTDEWEAVAPEPVWRDVTAECFPLKGSNGESWTHSVKYVLGTMVDGYRLRKVQRREIPSMMDYAFIIEIQLVNGGFKFLSQ